MNGPPGIGSGDGGHRMLTALVVVLSVGLLAYGVGHLTGTLDRQLPPAAYFVVALVLFGHAGYQVRRS